MLLDIDCFYASVEMALHPELKGKPLCIGGNRPSRGGSRRGIVACPNYEARAYGVRTAMPLVVADRLLPAEAVFMPGNHRLYGEYSDRVMDLLYRFTPDIEQVSIDEAYMDITGCLHLWGHDPVRMAMAMKECIRDECGLSVSIGIASNKICAKIAAGLQKPDGLIVVPHGGEEEFLAPLPVETVPGIGVKTAPKLHALGMHTVGDVIRQKEKGKRSGREHLEFLFHSLAGGSGSATVRHRVERSISRDTTFLHDTRDREFIASTLYYLTERCCKTLRKRQQAALTVTTKVRFADFVTVQKQITLSTPSSCEEEIVAAAERLLGMLFTGRRLVRLVGVKVSHLRAVEECQMDVMTSEKREQLHRRVDSLQAKFGYTVLQWGVTHHLHSPVYELPSGGRHGAIRRPAVSPNRDVNKQRV